MFKFLRKMFRRKRSKVDVLDIGEMLRNKKYNKPVTQDSVNTVEETTPVNPQVDVVAPVPRTPAKLTVVDKPKAREAVKRSSDPSPRSGSNSVRPEDDEYWKAFSITSAAAAVVIPDSSNTSQSYSCDNSNTSGGSSDTGSSPCD